MRTVEQDPVFPYGNDGLRCVKTVFGELIDQFVKYAEVGGKIPSGTIERRFSR